jgi:hypothetical protein
LRVPALLSAAVLASGLLTITQPAHASVPAVRFTRIWYDSPGADRRSNASLNAEYVRIANASRKTVNLNNWTLRDKTGYRYTFGAVLLKPGKTLTVRTGRGRDTRTTVYWGRRAYVWNNGKDTAYLRNAAGRLVDSCSYNSTRVDYTNCS